VGAVTVDAAAVALREAKLLLLDAADVPLPPLRPTRKLSMANR
jgi:hypothetical protein